MTASSPRFWRLPILALLLALGLSSCTDEADPGGGSPRSERPTAPPSESAVPPTTPVVRASLVGVDTGKLPQLPPSSGLGMPSAIPRPDANLPSLHDDLPGRAVLVVNPKITTLNMSVQEWSELTLLFFGVDGRWRRLSMADLGLSESLIPNDTFGAGELSWDGRWWAAPTHTGIVALDLTTGTTHTVRIRHSGTWVRGRHAMLSTVGKEISVPQGTFTQVPYFSGGVGYEPDGTPVSLIRNAFGQAALVEWRGVSYHERAVVPAAEPPRFVMPPGSHRKVFRAGELTGVAAAEGRFATNVSRGRNRLAVVVADSATGTTIGELTLDKREFSLTYVDTWLDNQTLLIAAVPDFVAWRPSTGELFRVTDARPLTDAYWDITSARDATAR